MQTPGLRSPRAQQRPKDSTRAGDGTAGHRRRDATCDSHLDVPRMVDQSRIAWSPGDHHAARQPVSFTRHDARLPEASLSPGARWLLALRWPRNACRAGRDLLPAGEFFLHDCSQGGMVAPVSYNELGSGMPVLILHGAGVDHREMTAALEPLFAQ